MININITTKKNPYLVESSKRTKETIKLAIKRGLFEKFDINKNLIKDYLKSKEEIPIWILEAACKINEKDILIPINYQNLWLCLHGSKVRRIQPSGRIINPRVHFTSVYVKSNDKLSNLIDEASKITGRKDKFVKLCGFNSRRVYPYWKKYAIPITAVMKICQILNKELINVLNDCEIYGNKIGKIYFSSKRTAELEKLLYWIKTEGHLQIYSTHIEIPQKIESKERLIELKRLFKKVFNLNDNSIKIRYSKSWKGYSLVISSASLRFILNLVYKIPLGYKCNSMIKDNSLNLEDYTKEEKLNILSSFCETEGSFSNTKTHCKFLSPRFEFKVYDKTLVEEFSILLKELEFTNLNIKYNQKKREHQLGIYNFNEFLRLCFLVYPYLGKNNKKRILNMLSTEDLLARIYLKNKVISSLMKNAVNNFNLKKDFVKKIKSEHILYYKTKYANDWISGKGGVPLSAILYSSNLLDKNIFNYIPKHMSILLYAHKVINHKEFTKFRGIDYES